MIKNKYKLSIKRKKKKKIKYNLKNDYLIQFIIYQSLSCLALLFFLLFTYTLSFFFFCLTKSRNTPTLSL